MLHARDGTDDKEPLNPPPGSIHNPLAKGCHRLIKDGAKLIETAQDVLEELDVPRYSNRFKLPLSDLQYL